MPAKSPPRRSPLPLETCNLARAFALIGDRWSLMILRSALFGVRRFDDFAAELGAPRTVLANRLKRLTAAGLLARRDYREPGRRARPEYWLTPMSASLRLPFLALTEWSDHWLSDDHPPPLAYCARAQPAKRCASRWSMRPGMRSPPPNNVCGSPRSVTARQRWDDLIGGSIARGRQCR